ncbi:uncharacterized protein LOC141728958 [Zonotrichia albicollis]|uniref:uncharacterized protein LOC141728958 n=1 Tax=Zonotrichia albicollis TaxID=44394 RepID=UPI003D81216F
MSVSCCRSGSLQGRGVPAVSSRGVPDGAAVRSRGGSAPHPLPSRSRRAPAARWRPGARSSYLRGEPARAQEHGTRPSGPPSEPGRGSQPRGGSGATLHLPPRCCPPRSASREESRPEPPPRLPLRRGADTAAGRGPGRGARKPDAARSFSRRAHKVPALPALPTAGRPRRAAPALRPREEGGRGGGGVKRRPNWGGKEGGRGHRRGESRGREGGRGPPAPPPSPYRQESAIRPPLGRSHRRRRRRSPGPARLLSPAHTGQRRARRRAAAPQSNRYRSRAPPGRAGRGGAQRSARLPPPPACPPAAVTHLPAPAAPSSPGAAAAGPRRLPRRLRSAGHVTGPLSRPRKGGSRRAEPSMGEVEAGPRAAKEMNGEAYAALQSQTRDDAEPRGLKQQDEVSTKQPTRTGK